ncbi:LysR family transcriptional regulator [Pusillimonas sp. CC-YST705]|uniref:LysR family transcriptional regulator n=2 Tax=Mesopusillimonas faecipullorum TaxID=2755040 RepID=A0ABS8CCW5_9BURK|nr:LysR family transcriptional regulator [Mesopusillimonas faecipullorum]
MRLYRDQVIAVGPGKITLLEAIDQTGSISAAARHLNMSYRRAWLLVNETNSSMTKPAVVSSEGGASGGGTRLTDTGRQLIQLYRNAESKALAAAKEDLDALAKLVKA